MQPLGPRLAVRRRGGEHTLPSGIVLLEPDMRDAHLGLVVGVGGPHVINGVKLPLDVELGDEVIYSARVDTFRVGLTTVVDIVDENSVIGVF